VALHYYQWRIAKNGGGYTQTGVAKKPRRLVYAVYPRIPPNTPLTTTILHLRIGARLTRYRNCKFHNFARTISRHAGGISRYSVPPSAGPLLPLVRRPLDVNHNFGIIVRLS